MKTMNCDLIVGNITTVEKEDETTYSVPLTGKTGDSEVKLVVKVVNHDILDEYGIGEVGNKVSVAISATNSRLDSFMDE